MIVSPSDSLFKKKDGCYIKGKGFLIPFDVITSERHRMESALAVHPMDGDKEISTHIHNKLRTGELEGVVSNWSVNRPLFLSNRGFTFSNPSELNTAKATYDALRDLYQAKLVVEVVLGLTSYSNVVLTSIEAGRTGDSGDAQSFSIRFQQVKIVKLKKTQISAGVNQTKTTNADGQQSSLKADNGSQSTSASN